MSEPKAANLNTRTKPSEAGPRPSNDRAAPRIARSEPRAPVWSLSYDANLPIVSAKEEICSAIRANPVCVIAGETGSGKSTQIPKFLLELGFGRHGRIGMTQPRRIAARAIAARLAEETATELGRSIGVSTRFDDRVVAETAIKVMTDGILLNEIHSDRRLAGYEALIIDEAHERSLNIDFLLGYLKTLTAKRRDLRVVITSATIDPERFARFYDNAPVVRVGGRGFPVEVRFRGPDALKARAEGKLAIGSHPEGTRQGPDGCPTGVPGLPGATSPVTPSDGGASPSGGASPTGRGSPLVDRHGLSAGRTAGERGRDPARKRGRKRPAPEARDINRDRDLNAEIADAIRELAREGRDRVLVFLPGEREISELREHLKGALRNETEVLPLYSRLPRAAQDRVYSKARGARIVLATNVAETSLTVPGINAVVDTGTARISRYSPRSKVQRLPVEPVSRAAATQRSGRCGREGPGVAIRLYDQEEFERRPEFTDPEILRTNLATVILKLKSLGIGELDSFPFLDPPPRRLVKDGYRLLEELGALNPAGRLTKTGRLLARLPIDPQLGRMLVQARDEQAVRELTVLCAALSVQDPREWPSDQQEAALEAYQPWRDARSDFLWFLNFWDREIEARASWGELKKTCLAHKISFLRVREWIDIHRQLTTQLKKEGFKFNEIPASYKTLHRCLLSGLLSNVARLNERKEYVSARGTVFRLARTSVLSGKRVPWLLVMQIVETRRTSARLAARIDPAWVLQAATHVLSTDLGEIFWDKVRGEAQVKASKRLYQHTVISDLTLKLADFDPATARQMLVREGLIQGQMPFRTKALKSFRAEFERLDYEEHKRRRRDLLADENRLTEALLAAIPEDVCDARALEEATKVTPDLLAEPTAALRVGAGIAAGAGGFPEAFSVLGHALPLTYCFEPGTEADGMTVQVPLHLLNALAPEYFERLVPGYLGEKLETYLRSLPKRQRKKLQPIATHVEALLRELPNQPGRLGDALATWVSARIGEPVTADLFVEDELPPHLRMRYALCGEDGKVLSISRDLDALKQSFESSGRGAFTRAAGGEQGLMDDSEVTRFIWDEIPESVQLGADAAILGWPAPTDLGEGVSLRMYQTAEEALAVFPAGLMRLAQIMLAKELKYARRKLPHADAIALGYMAFGDVATLKDALVDAVVTELMDVQRKPLRTRAAFEARVNETGAQLMPALTRYAERLAEACTLSAELRRALAQIEDKEFVAEINALQMYWLGPDCLARFPLLALNEFPRYLRAGITRVQRFAQDPGKDHKRAAQFARHFARFERWAAAPLRTPCEISDARMLMEEFRVSLFAQELGTRRKVSPERLTAFFEQGLPL